jgi:hypothetical protein
MSPGSGIGGKKLKTKPEMGCDHLWGRAECMTRRLVPGKREDAGGTLGRCFSQIRRKRGGTFWPSARSFPAGVVARTWRDTIAAATRAFVALKTPLTPD